MSSILSDDSDEELTIDPSKIVVSAPFQDQDLPPEQPTKDTQLQLGEVYARRGLLVGAEAVILDTEQHDYVAAYLYYCSAVKILVASLKGLQSNYRECVFSALFFIVFVFFWNRNFMERSRRSTTCERENK